MGEVPNMHLFSQLGEFVSFDITKPEDTVTRLQDADVVVTCKVIIDKQVMQQLPRLKLICVAATGMNNIDLDYASSVGVTVKNVAGYSTNSVAQATFAMLLSLLNQVEYYNNYVHSGKYALNDMFTHMGRTVFELNGKRFGIIGLGNIGKKVALIAEAFGCEVVYYSTSGLNKNETFESLSLDQLLATSDVVSIHSPLNEKTANLIAIEQLKLMKPTAILINTGRGGIVNEQDLAYALDANIIAGACIDVYSKEPILPNNPLLSITNKSKVLLAPHTAWISFEARTLLIERIVENIRGHYNLQ